MQARRAAEIAAEEAERRRLEQLEREAKEKKQQEDIDRLRAEVTPPTPVRSTLVLSASLPGYYVQTTPPRVKAHAREVVFSCLEVRNNEGKLTVSCFNV